MSIRRFFLLSLLTGTSLAGAIPAFAQVASAPPPAESALDEVVVTGTRASLEHSLDIKRQTLGVVDSISAEDIGKLPDQNVAESLQRVPGVSIDRDQGEGRFITVRGFGPEFNTVLLNGRVLATDNPGREFSFDILPPELVSGADVYKTSSAEFQDGGIGSTVNLRTARPTDHRGFFVAGSLGGKYNSEASKTTPTGSLLASYTTPDDRFGILGSLVYDKRDQRAKRAYALGWLVDQTAGNLTGVAVEGGTGQSVDTSSRERIGGTVALDWHLNDQLMLTVDGLYSKYKVDSVTNSIGYFSDPADIISATANSNGTVTHYVRGALGDLHTDISVGGLAPRDAQTYQIGTNLKWTPGERTTITTDLSWSRATNNGKDKNPLVVVGLSDAAFNPTWDINPGQPSPSYSNVAPLTDAADARGHFSRLTGDNTSDDVKQVRIEGQQKFDGVFNTLKFGFLGSRREKVDNYYETPFDWECAYCGYQLPLPANLNLLHVFNSGSGQFLGSSTLPTQWLTFNPAQMQAYFLTDAALAHSLPFFSGPAIAQYGKTYAGEFKPQQSSSVLERSYAFYLQGELGGHVGNMPWSASAGLREVLTRLKADGTAQDLIALTPIPGDNTNLAQTLSDPLPVSATNNYHYLLPSFTARLNLTDELVARVAGSRTLTRPTLSDLGFGQSYTTRPPNQFFVTGNGNPYLKPYLAWNADSSLDYYLNRVSYASIAGFYKKISNFVSQVGVQRELLGYDFLDTRLRNAQSATVYGAEFTLQTTFDFLPSPLDGFGVSANYTKVTSSQTFDPSLTTQVFNVEGLSDSANIVLFYEKGPVQIRGAYNWRAGFLRHTNNGFVAGQPENVDSYGQYDASASYAIRPNLSIYIQAVNITNAFSRSYQAYEERLLSLEETGRQLQFGVRGHF